MSAACFLGVDVGGTKTHALIADETGRALGLGESGPGNHELVGYEGLAGALRQAVERALAAAGLDAGRISGAGFGVAGYDWPSERPATLAAIATLGLACPLEVVNDALIGLLAGSPQGWGVAVVSGTGSNARGWDRQHVREGMVTSAGLLMGEGAGASELVGKAVQVVAQAWTRRGPATRLSAAFVAQVGARDTADLLEGLLDGRYALGSVDAPLVFQVAAAGDEVALGLLEWAGCELGELANCVIRQLEFQDLEFDVVQVGSLYKASPLLGEAMCRSVHALAPGARLVRLAAPPVTGAVYLGMRQAGLQPSAHVRRTLERTAGA